MKKFGLIGYPLEHSFSCDYFNDKFRKAGIDAVYANYPMRSLEGLRELVESEGLDGLNVTSPYKVEILEKLDDIDIHADIIEAVNVVTVEDIDGNKFMKGYNTDWIAFRDSAIPLMQAHHLSALILGTGGAARSVAYALTQLGIECVYVSRKPCAEGVLYHEIDEKMLKRFKIIVNCTPVGMYPKVNARPKLPYKLLTPEHLLYDLTYNPSMAKFLEAGASNGAQVKNGLEMLYRQAELSWKLWHTQPIDESSPKSGA